MAVFIIVNPHIAELAGVASATSLADDFSDLKQPKIAEISPVGSNPWVG